MAISGSDAPSRASRAFCSRLTSTCSSQEPLGHDQGLLVGLAADDADAGLAQPGTDQQQGAVDGFAHGDRRGRRAGLAGEGAQFVGDQADPVGQARDQAQIAPRGVGVGAVEEDRGVVGIGADGGDRLVDLVGHAGGDPGPASPACWTAPARRASGGHGPRPVAVPPSRRSGGGWTCAARRCAPQPWPPARRGRPPGGRRGGWPGRASAARPRPGRRSSARPARPRPARRPPRR